MLLARFQCMGRILWGEPLDGGARFRVLSGSPYEGRMEPAGPEVAQESVRLLPPAAPSKIVCIGSNYRAHCAEMGRPVPSEPLLFLKPPSSLVAHGEPIVLPPGVGRVELEGELAVVIGRRARRVNPGSAREHVLGLTLLNDVTARELQRRDVQFTRAKGFDTFCPLGPWVATGLDPGSLRLRTRLNGELRQDTATDDIVFGVPELVSFASHVMTLEPGDVVSTGTPAGVCPLSAGDVVSIEVEGIGTLRNPVVSS